MQQNRWRHGLRLRPRWRSFRIPLMKSMHDTLFRIIAPDASIYVQNAPNRWRLGLRPRPRWGSLYIPLMKSMTLHKIIAPNASISVQNAAKLLAAGAPPQTPLGSFRIPLMKSMTHYLESLHQMLPFMSKMHQNRWRLGRSAPDPAGGTYSAPPGSLAVKGWDGDLVITLVGIDFDRCPSIVTGAPLLF